MDYKSNQKAEIVSLDLKKNPNLSICCLYKTHFRFKDKCMIKLKEWKRIYHVNSNRNRAGVAIQISDKIGFACD